MDAFISMICYFGCNFAPVNWAFCGGQIIAINDNQSLFSLIGSSYGGDGRVSFGLPDLRARVPVGSYDMGNPPGLSPIMRGQMGGAQTHTLSIAQMPQHSHAASFTPVGTSGGTMTLDVQFKASSADATEHSAGSGTPPAMSLAAPVAGLNSAKGYNSSTPDVALDGVEASGSVSGITVNGNISVQDAGSGSSFPILNPVTGLNACICTIGIYPSRN